MNVANSKTDRPGRSIRLWRTLGVICGLAAIAAGYHFTFRYDPVRREAWRKVEPRLQKMDEEASGQVDASAEEIKSFFAERRQHARGFAEDVLSLSGKWAYLAGYFQSGNHERYLQESFERHIFSSTDLESLIESAVKRYVSEIQGRENQLLVDIRADLEDSDLSGPKYLPSLGSEADFRREYEAMLQKVLPVVQKDLGVTVGREVVSFIGGEIASALIIEIGASLATELGISGGILGAGAYSGVVTFGVGVVAGILVDMTVNWAMRQAGYDPEGEIAAKVIESLNRVENTILDGSWRTRKGYYTSSFYSWCSWSAADRAKAAAEAQSIEAAGGLGLSAQIDRINKARTKLRNETLKSLILKGGVE